MSITVKLEIGNTEYVGVFEKGEMTVSGGDEVFNAALHRLFEIAAGEYSPAMGGKGTFVANQVAEVTKGKILAVDEPLSEEGVVY